MNGMKLQKCRPDFMDARNAIIQADEILTGGENFCEIWKGFAAKGLGNDATVIGKTPWGGGIRTDVSSELLDLDDLIGMGPFTDSQKHRASPFLRLVKSRPVRRD